MSLNKDGTWAHSPEFSLPNRPSRKKPNQPNQLQPFNPAEEISRKTANPRLLHVFSQASLVSRESSRQIDRHSGRVCESLNPVGSKQTWIPACAGMTQLTNRTRARTLNKLFQERMDAFVLADLSSQSGEVAFA